MTNGPTIVLTSEALAPAEVRRLVRGTEGCVEFTAMINIRPAQGNAGMEIQDPEVRRVVRDVVSRVLGRGEPL